MTVHTFNYQLKPQSSHWRRQVMLINYVLPYPFSATDFKNNRTAESASETKKNLAAIQNINNQSKFKGNILNVITKFSISIILSIEDRFN